MLTERRAPELPRSLEKTRIDLLNIMSKRLEESMLAAGDDSFDDLTEVSEHLSYAVAGLRRLVCWWCCPQRPRLGFGLSRCAASCVAAGRAACTRCSRAVS